MCKFMKPKLNLFDFRTEENLIKKAPLYNGALILFKIREGFVVLNLQ
jgi:hypothetical protein